MKAAWVGVWAGIWIAAVPAGGRAAYPQTLTTTTPFLNLPRPTDDPRWKEAFAHWDRREDTAEVMQALARVEALARDYPDRAVVQVWLARVTFMAGIRTKNDLPRQVEWMKKSVAAADKALALEPDNGFARYWRYCAMAFYHAFTPQEFAEIRGFGAKYRHLRELPAPDDDLLWAAALSHWDQRLDRGESLKAIAGFEQLEKKYPARIEPKLWLMRVNYWMHYISPTEEEKARWAKIAAEWGKQALAIEPRNPSANYLTAASYGMYATHTSFLNYVRYALEIVERLTVVMEEDPNYFYGGCSQYFALAIARAGSLVSRSIGVAGFSEEVIVRNTVFASHYEPGYLRNHLALGEMYLAQGKTEEGRKMLEKVLRSDPTELKNMEPENRVAQDLARELWAEHFPGQTPP